MKERSEERRKRIVGNIAHSHEEAEARDRWFWQTLTPQQCISAQAAAVTYIRGEFGADVKPNEVGDAFFSRIARRFEQLGSKRKPCR